MSITMKEAIEEVGWLGIVREIHSIGPYDLVEYEQKDIVNSEDNGKAFYHVFVEDKNTNNSFRSIDVALIFAVSKRNLHEPNTARWYAQAANKILMLQEPSP